MSEETIMDLLFQEHDRALERGNPVERWKFSPEGWNKLRMWADMNGLYIDPELCQGMTIIGLPYSVTCDLPREVMFEPVHEHPAVKLPPSEKTQLRILAIAAFWLVVAGVGWIMGIW